MAHPREMVDGVFLTQIARAICGEIPRRTGESAAGRVRLLEHLNAKMAALALPQVETGDAVAHEQDAAVLIAQAIADEGLSAHTRNFLQTALSRLERFDEFRTAT